MFGELNSLADYSLLYSNDKNRWQKSVASMKTDFNQIYSQFWIPLKNDFNVTNGIKIKFVVKYELKFK